MRPLAEKECIVVGLRTIDHHDIDSFPFRIREIMVSDIPALQLANLDIIKGDIVVELFCLDHTVICDHWHILCPGFRNNGRRRHAIMGADDQDTITIGQICFGLLKLEIRIALSIRIINMHTGDGRLNGLDKQGMILALPARRRDRLGKQDTYFCTSFATIRGIWPTAASASIAGGQKKGRENKGTNQENMHPLYWM